MEENTKKEFIEEVMNTPLFSMTEKFNIIIKLKNNELSEENTNQILDLIHNFNNGLSEVVENYYKDMDKVYAQYLDKNIQQLKQWTEKITLEVREEKSNENEWNPDSILDQIE